jgi:hypothetical protein
MSSWSVNSPTVEGWYLWRHKREGDPWKWTAYFVLKEDDHVTFSYWADGTEVQKPRNGVWSIRFDPDQDRHEP